jgi:hypothetical protein
MLVVVVVVVVVTATVARVEVGIQPVVMHVTFRVVVRGIGIDRGRRY